MAKKMTIIEAQALEIELLSQSKRMRIAVNVNTQFSNIEVIKREKGAEVVSAKKVGHRAHGTARKRSFKDGREGC